MQELINSSTKNITLGRNDFLREKGSIDTNLYYLTSGSMQIYVLNGSEEQIIRLVYKDNIFVILDSFLIGTPTNFYVKAIKKTELKVITKEQVEQFLKLSDNQQLWYKILEDLIIQQMEREVDILTPSAEERYQRVLQRSPKLFQEIPNRYIANYLRMTPETLSRLKKS